MNKKIKFSVSKLIFFLVLVIILYLVGLKYITSHEFIHRKIYDRYDIPSFSEITLTLEAKTLISSLDYGKCSDFCKLQHTLNDIIGYNLTIFIFNLWALFFLWLLYQKIFKNENKNRNNN